VGYFMGGDFDLAGRPVSQFERGIHHGRLLALASHDAGAGVGHYGGGAGLRIAATVGRLSARDLRETIPGGL
jgi:hypothetical protein